jgi:hypothetical protein
MKKACKFAVVLGIGLVLDPWANAQAPAGQPAEPAPLSAIAAPPLPPEDQPTRQQLAKLFEVMRTREQYESVTKMVSAMTSQQMASSMDETIANNPGLNGLKAEDKARLKEILAKFGEQTSAIYSSDQMIEDMTEIYQRHLSRSDVDGMITFMKSTAGRHFLDQNPVITQELMAIVMKRTHGAAKTLAEQESKDIQELIGAALAADQKSGQTGSNKTSIVDRIEKYVAAFASSYKPGQSVSQTLVNALTSGTTQ